MRNGKRYYTLAEDIRLDIAVVEYWIRKSKSWKETVGLFKLKIILSSWVDVLES